MITILTCETQECLNANIGVYFENAPDIVVCGVCMNEISNKTNIDKV